MRGCWSRKVLIDDDFGRNIEQYITNVSAGIFDVLNDAECNSQIMSFAFGVFLHFEANKVIRCRSPPLISLKKIQIDWRKRNG